MCYFFFRKEDSLFFCGFDKSNPCIKWAFPTEKGACPFFYPNLILLSLVISFIEILKHYIIIFDQPLIGKAEIAIIPDNDVIQHL